MAHLERFLGVGDPYRAEPRPDRELMYGESGAVCRCLMRSDACGASLSKS